MSCDTKIQQRSDRKVKVEVPLFNNYIFVQLLEKDRNLIFDSPGVVRYLFWLGKHAIVKDHEIATIKEWLDTEILLKKYRLCNIKLVIRYI